MATKAAPHILIVDDDRRLRKLLNQYLSEHGFTVTAAENTGEARQHLKDEHFDLMVLDVMMPGETGFDFIKAVKGGKVPALQCPPILMLTAMGEPEHRITGLEDGAEDYLVKPFEPKELLLRIQNILRRPSISQPTRNIIQLGDMHFDCDRSLLFKGSEPQSLTSAEANLLQFFGQHLGEIISRDELAERFGVPLTPRTIDVQVTRLRRKIEPNPKQPIYLKTVRHKGYVLWCED